MRVRVWDCRRSLARFQVPGPEDDTTLTREMHALESRAQEGPTDDSGLEPVLDESCGHAGNVQASRREGSVDDEAPANQHDMYANGLGTLLVSLPCSPLCSCLFSSRAVSAQCKQGSARRPGGRLGWRE